MQFRVLLLNLDPLLVVPVSVLSRLHELVSHLHQLLGLLGVRIGPLLDLPSHHFNVLIQLTYDLRRLLMLLCLPLKQSLDVFCLLLN
jgi:hypothetical protein